MNDTMFESGSPILLGSIGRARGYGLYTIAAIIPMFFVLKYVHERKGRELEQMED